MVAILLAAFALLATAAAAQTATARYEFSKDEQVHYYLYRTYSWQRMALLGMDSGLDHLLREPRHWNRSADHYFLRYGSAFSRRVVRNSIELGVGIALKEDVRFRESGERGFLNRVRFASVGAFTARDAEGNRRFSYARLAATAGGALIASAWHQRCSHTGVLERVGNGYFGHLQNSLLTEFAPDAKRFGRKLRLALFRR